MSTIPPGAVPPPDNRPIMVKLTDIFGDRQTADLMVDRLKTMGLHIGTEEVVPVREHVARLTKDLREAARFMTVQEARFLVSAYYTIQDDRKRSSNQVRTMGEKPHALLEWYADQNEMFEAQIKVSLDVFTDNHEVGRWLKKLYGVGPVIAAGLLAHIDIEKAPTAGHIWSFAGLDPTRKWEKGQKRPWNADLKTLCWKAGQSWMKFSNRPNCFYGILYKERKAQEVMRNDTGKHKEYAASVVEKYNKSTEAYKHLLGGKLPPAQVDARARRWVVKIFLSHLQQVWYWTHYGSLAPKPFAEAILGHAHIIAPPNMPPEMIQARNSMTAPTLAEVRARYAQNTT